jgi:hypothetical protein
LRPHSLGKTALAVEIGFTIFADIPIWGLRGKAFFLLATFVILISAKAGQYITA